MASFVGQMFIQVLFAAVFSGPPQKVIKSMQNPFSFVRRGVPRARRLFLESLECRHLLAGASISGVVWSDTNQNGTREATEAPVAGVKVYLDANDNGKLDTGETSVVTANDGS